MDDLGLYDIYPCAHIPWWKTQWFFWGIRATLVVLSLALAYAVWHWYQRYRLARRTPEQKARALLVELEKRSLITVEERQWAVNQLALIVRSYLTNRFAIESAGLTDEELIQRIKEKEMSLDEQNMSIVSKLCIESYPYRFAHKVPQMSQIMDDIILAHSLVKSLAQDSSHRG